MDVHPPIRKRQRETDEEGAYIQENGTHHNSIVFSLKDEKGSLVNALKPFEVSVIVIHPLLISLLIGGRY